MIEYRLIILTMKNVSEEAEQKYKTHSLCSITFSPENRVFYEIRQKIIVESDGPQMTIIWRMRVLCCITETTGILRVCYNYCFSTAKTVTRTRLNVYIYMYIVCLV
jgi:hypothetical protein